MLPVLGSAGAAGQRLNGANMYRPRSLGVRTSFEGSAPGGGEARYIADLISFLHITRHALAYQRQVTIMGRNQTGLRGAAIQKNGRLKNGDLCGRAFRV